mmetsp:Transcript_92553/g.270939  ORF Transcript_92553/g.270939 Transcript_92553/m.270939 type:complete len:336 (+) Transcript_92553:378-1385(+)
MLQLVSEGIMPVIVNLGAIDVAPYAACMVVVEAAISLVLQVRVAHKEVVHVRHLERGVEELLALSMAYWTDSVVADQEDAVMVCVSLTAIKSHERPNHFALIAHRVDLVRGDQAEMLLPPPLRLPEVLAADHHVAEAHHVRAPHRVRCLLVGSGVVGPEGRERALGAALLQHALDVALPPVSGVGAAALVGKVAGNRGQCGVTGRHLLTPSKHLQLIAFRALQAHDLASSRLFVLVQRQARRVCESSQLLLGGRVQAKANECRLLCLVRDVHRCIVAMAAHVEGGVAFAHSSHAKVQAKLLHDVQVRCCESNVPHIPDLDVRIDSRVDKIASFAL